MKKLLLGTFATFIAISGQAQLTTDNTQTPQQLVVGALLGQGITATNITFNGSNIDSINVQIGSYYAFGNDLGMASGVMMATEGISFINEDYNSYITNGIVNDPDLLLLANNPCEAFNDVAILEFDFIPAGDTMVFDYVFGSQEYGSFTCSQYNDAFGFFLSGAGINGAYSNNSINIANIPGSATPVAINTVNNGIPDGGGDGTVCEYANPNWQNDVQYFNREIIDYSDSTLVKISGLTNVLSAVYYGLVIGDTYHIKMALGDACDQALNSAVFFSGSSFRIMGGGATALGENNASEIEISTLGNNGLFQIKNTNGKLIETTVYNLVGKRVFQNKSAESQLDLSNLSAGVYVAQFKAGNKTITKKLVIK